MKKYSLINKKTQKLIEYATSVNNGDFCVDIEYTLCENGEQLWLVDLYEIAKSVHFSPTARYNARYETPNYDLDMNDYEIIEVHLFTTKI